MASKRIFSMLFHPTRPGQFLLQFGYKTFFIVSWIPAVIFFNEHVGEIAQVHGPSMYPYLNSDFNVNLKKDLCWISRWNPTENIQRGMIVSFR